MKRSVYLAVGVMLLTAVASLAGEGVVALQTAEPSCGDDSGNIYVDCGNGTVTDNRTGLVWLANASCMGGFETMDWSTAMEFVASLADVSDGSPAAFHDCGLSDGSSPGEWRLPTISEWETMVSNALGNSDDPDCTQSPPTITNDSGGGCSVSGPSAFVGVESGDYWSSTQTTIITGHPCVPPTAAWSMSLQTGFPGESCKSNVHFVWPVRGGQ